APSSASISACVTTSPSEWPASPRDESNATPPSTSGTPGSRACASKPVPIRRSEGTQDLRQLRQRVDLRIGLRGFRPLRLQVAPWPAPDEDGYQSGSLGR